MAKARSRRQPSRRKEKVDTRRRKRIVHRFAEDDYVDYKDVALLRKFMSDKGKIRGCGLGRVHRHRNQSQLRLPPRGLPRGRRAHYVHGGRG